MFKQNENGINYFGNALLLFVFQVFLFAFVQNPDAHIDTSSNYKIDSVLHSDPAIKVEVQQIHFQNGIFASFVDNSNFRLCKGVSKVICENNIIHQRIISLQKTEILIKPVLLQRLYRQYHFTDTDDLPHLS